MSETLFGGGAVLVGALIVLTKMLKWPGGLNYAWGIIVLAWGIMALL